MLLGSISFIFSKVIVNWKLYVLFGILAQESVAEVTLKPSSSNILENSPLTLTCSYSGSLTVETFTMIVSSAPTSVGSLFADCSVFAATPDPALYEYACPTNRQLTWTIKNITRASDGDTWRCLVGFTTTGSEDAYFTINLQGNIRIEVPAAGNCGDDTELKCYFTGQLGSPVKWTQDGRRIMHNGAVVRPEDVGKYTERRDQVDQGFVTLVIHNTTRSDKVKYGCEIGFEQTGSPVDNDKYLYFECKASLAVLNLTDGKKVIITIDKLYPASPTFSASFNKENSVVTVPGSRTCSSSTLYSGFYKCVWTSSNSLADGSYTYSFIVTTVTQADPLTGTFKIVSPQTPTISNVIKLEDTREVLYGHKGNLLTITCTSSGGYPKPALVWYKENVSSNNQMVSTSSGTLESNGTYTITLQHTFTPSATDDLKYMICRSYYPQADSAQRGSKTKSAILYLLPIISSFYIEHEGEKSEIVNEHDVNVRITCEVDSSQRSTIKIMFDGEVLTEETNVKLLPFTLNDVSCLQAGVYTCEASEEHGHASITNLTLFVKCSPRPLKKMKENITASLYAPRTLSFTTIAYPEPGPSGFVWHKENVARWTPVLGNTDIQILSSGLQSNLTILNVSQSDYGQYRVTVNNSIGSFEQHMYLIQNGDKGVCTDNTANNNKQTDNTGNNNTQTALIVGVTLGVFSAVVVVCAIYVTIVLKRKNTDKGTGRLNKSTTQTTYANLGFKSNVKGNRAGASNCKNTDILSGEEISAEKQYTSLDQGTKDDNREYDIIHRS